MKLTFPGTKGEIEEENSRHKYHSSMIVEYSGTRVLLDYGEKHSTNLSKKINSLDALLITHAHPDHYQWTIRRDDEVSIPVYLTEITLNYGRYRPINTRVIKPGRFFNIKELKFKAYDLIHSIRCPAVCYRIEGNKKIIYAPDILDFVKPKEQILKNIDLLIADGASFDRSIVRRQGDKLFGHARIKTILGWCKKYGVKELIVTHCGKQLVTSDENEMMEKISWEAGSQVKVTIAIDRFSKEI